MLLFPDTLYSTILIIPKKKVNQDALYASNKISISRLVLLNTCVIDFVGLILKDKSLEFNIQPKADVLLFNFCSQYSFALVLLKVSLSFLRKESLDDSRLLLII